MDACVLLESSSRTLRRVLECFEVSIGVAMPFSRASISIFRFAFDFSLRDSFQQNLTL